MKGFLEQIAAYYHEHYGGELSEFGFVFPNRRAGLFFRKALAQQAQHPIFAPEILGINDLLLEHSDLQAADSITLLFELYKQYVRVMGSDEPFDQFITFGSMLLNDFNEVDKYMVDASQLFHNIADLNEINTVFDYLDDEQKRVISSFWSHFLPDSDKSLKRTYVDLWRKMEVLYHDFKQSLASRGLGYDGMIFRASAEQMASDMGRKERYKRMVFIGFNALNPTEKAVFDYYKRGGMGDYYFDYDLNWIKSQPQSAGLFMDWNLKHYSSEFTIEPVESNVPKVRVIAVPSQIGQTKQIYSLLNERGVSDSTENEQTAVILPDESLLTPMLHAIPEDIKTINVTMGYPLQLTPMCALMDHVALLQRETREQHGETLFYYKPVLAILNHPYIYSTDEEKIAALHRKLTESNMFLVSADTLAITPLLRSIFKPQRSLNETMDYVRELLTSIHSYLLEDGSSALDNEFIYSYEASFNRLCDNIKEHEMMLTGETFFRLLKQLTATISVPFKGEPLMGLQIMGMLESRALDFDRLIIASFNDDVIPRKEHPQSIIPYNLRKVFELPTYENNDAIYAYNFYRLLGRCRELTLLYDSRSDSNMGEISRFYYQLKYLFGVSMEEESVSYAIDFKSAGIIEIEKSGSVATALREFLKEDDYPVLSASALNSYINCPLQFYFSKIARLNENSEIDESLDAGTFGSIYHKVMERIYSDFVGREVSYEQLSAVLAQRARIDGYITETFNELYLRQKQVEPLTGFNLLVGKIIHKYIDYTLRYDMKRVPFVYLRSEELIVNHSVALSNGKGSVKFKGFIDRVQSRAGVTEIIDYKTGGDVLNYTDEEGLFIAKNKRPKEILQTLLYCMFYEQKYPGSVTKPEVYYVKNLPKHDFGIEITKNKVVVNSYKEVKESFEEYLRACLDEMFDEDIAFKQTDILDTCKYCSYKQICGR